MTDDAIDPELAERLGRMASWEPSGTDSADASGSDAVVAGADRRRRRRGMGVGVAAAVALIGATSVVTQLDRQADTVVMAGDRSDVQIGFAAWGPGWHVLDTGPVPAMSDASIEWIGDELLVVGDGQAFTFSPASRRWTERDAPPLTVRGMAMADGMLVAVGEGPEPTPEEYQQGAQAAPMAATFGPATHEWSALASVPVNEPLRAQSTGIRDSFYEPALAWNGSHLFDLGRGAVFDPEAGVWSALAMPDDLPAYAHLLSGQLATVDGAVELVSASAGPGLRWNRDGSEVAEIPGVPAELGAEVIGATSGAETADGLVVVDIDNGSDAPRRAFMYDGAYRSIAPPIEPQSRGCPQVAVAAGRAVALPCDPGGSFHELVASRWRPIGPAPLGERCCGAAATDTGDALVVWSTSTDTANDPGGAPYVRAAVWVPGGPSEVEEAPAPIMNACPLEDLGPVLIQAFGDLGWGGPQGKLDSNGGCLTQTWTSSTGLSVTQQQGATAPGVVLWQDAVADVRIGEAAPEGGTAQRYVASVRSTSWWATIEDLNGDPSAALDSLFKALIATRDRTGPINLDLRDAAPLPRGSIDGVNVEGADRGGTIRLTSSGGMSWRSISVAYSTQATTANCSDWGHSGIYLNVTVYPDDRSAETDPETFIPETIGTSGTLFGAGAVVCRANRTTYLSFELSQRVPIEVTDRPRDGTITISLG